MSVAWVMLQLVRTFLAIPLVLLLACTAATVTVTGDRRAPVSPSPSSASNARKALATVTRVVDGDTAHVLFRGRDVTVRFIGVDTPETVAPGQPIECYGPAASHFTTRQLTGRRIRLEFDVDRIDPFGRTLAYSWMRDGSMFNETLVRRGFATVATYPPDTRYVQRFETAQRAAKAAERGLWGAC
ncbi:MAG: thermonuclease family protein [Actinomycetota bacterium]|jgi:micrococcal nuclease